jgi:hypothetical protein
MSKSVEADDWPMADGRTGIYGYVCYTGTRPYTDRVTQLY